MSRTCAAIAAWVLVCATWVCAENEFVTSSDKFRLCDDKTGAGFYWTDSTTGRTWTMDTARGRWVLCGSPEGATPGPVGTYVPHENKSGPGVFVLNTATGEGWFYNGRSWKVLGIPLEKEPE